MRAYEVGVIGKEWRTVVHAMTAGKAKYLYLLDIRDCYEGISFKHLTCRSLGAPRTDDGFLKTAKYRGVPFARIGMRVEVEGSSGLIVGKNSSANFDVLFTDGKHKGGRYNCHPNWMFRYFDESGNIIAEYRDGKAPAEQPQETVTAGRDPEPSEPRSTIL